MRGRLLEAEGLVKRYRRGPEVVHALEDATFALDPGELVALVGPSGSGKTTLLNLVVGWEQPDEGRLFLGGEELREPAALGWDVLAIVPQRLGLVEELSVRENAELPLRLADHAATASKPRVDDLLERFGLAGLAERLPGEVSLGEQQRAALVRALVRSPRMLLVDEPTGHQDEGWATGVLQALHDACSGGTTCLMATHNTEHLELADRVLQIHDGRLG